MTAIRMGTLQGTKWALCLAALTAFAGCATSTLDTPRGSETARAVADASPAMRADQGSPAAAILPIAAPTHAPDTTQADGLPFAFALDPLRPMVPIDPDDASVHLDLWTRVRAGFAVRDLDNPLVGKWEQWYVTRPDYVKRMNERGGRYLFYIVEELDKRGMPTELALLPFIESAFNPQAMSGARASGMWQFMPATGKDFALKQNLFRDDRRDVLASTRAALDYLQLLQRQFGDWQLALAAYNWGQGNVQRAIERNQKAGLPGSYESLSMPDETRNYVPKLQAVKNIVLRPQAFAITLPALENHPYFLSVPITRDIDVEVAASLAGIDLEEFQQLNPQMNKPVILAAGTPQVLLPYDNATRFVRNLRAHRSPLATWTAWVAPSTLKPADVARQVGMNENDLRSVNQIPPRMLVKAGSTLLVPRDQHKAADVPEKIADNAVMALAPDAPPAIRVSFKAGKNGDSVAAVARRYHVSADHVAQWNSVAPGGSFRAGQSIVVIQARPAKVATKAAAPTASRTASARLPASKTAKSPVKATAKASPTSTKQRVAKV
jgi:membrane-bound lytic murein transglycosylase D